MSDPLDRLENQSLYILREAYHKFDRLAMLWSIGKDSTALLWLARKAFVGHVPFPLVHVDTTYKIQSMIEYRDELVRTWKLQLIVGKNNPVLEAGQTFPNARATRVECCGTLKKDALRQVLDENGFTGVIVGVRRDEEPTRAKERYFSPRILKAVMSGPLGASARAAAQERLLTAREREILVLLAEGASLKEIATQLRLSVKTVDAHKVNLMRKLDLHDRAQLIRYAVRTKLVEA